MAFGQLRWFVVQSEYAEIFKSWSFFIFFIEVLKVLFWYVKYIITNVWEALPQELVNFYQFLYHVTLVVLFQLKNWSDSTFHCFVHWELVETLLKDNPAFYMVIILNFLNCPTIPWIRSAERIRGTGRSF